VHAISHRLHPSKMEALGLVATANGHCRDVSRQSLPVHFQHADVPSGIQPDRALSVFRILEEALTNVVRHSGATEARVMLHGTDTHIVLRVADNGRGFVEPTRSAGGLGLASMRERLQLLEGSLSITSVPAKGTVVEARIPLVHARDSRASSEPSSRDSVSRITPSSPRNFAGSA
jgi:signal transduction histidine kinase